ncbi:MAG: right-handed parallel beta-helix repeat-containing protein [candidate division Zixibacteria bacterium]|nr:right-handed parallel beta-helix repeat-containing protein [candidate division Zixibacteria bacterium]
MFKKIVMVLCGGALWSFHLFIALNIVLTGYCEASKNNEKEGPIGMANPATVYCIEMGYEYKITDGPSGQSGVCIFPDGSQCDGWDFLNGKCGANYSYCAKNGYDMEIRTDGKNPFSKEYAVCVSKTGNLIGSVTELTGLSERSEKGATTPSPFEKRENVEELSLGLFAPSSFDWRNHNGYNWMTSVKNQGGCGSCWAFSAIGIVEAVYNIRYDNPNLDLNLSEEYLVSDCQKYSGSQNCCGGWKDAALDFIKKYGVPDENCMPYVDTYTCSCPDTCYDNCSYKTYGSCSDAACSDRCADWESRVVKIDSSAKVSTNRETIKQYLLAKGPLAVSIGIGSSFGGHWDGDIYRCTDDNSTNHAVIIAGYNEDDDYWIIKNSWGTGWNGDGYYKLGYGECSVEKYVYYTDRLDCGCNIASNTVLDKDYLNCAGGGLSIGADGITLNCNGHIIAGDSTGSGVTLSGRSNVTVKNCNIQAFEKGIYVSSGSGDTLINNITNYNSAYGIHLDSSSGNILSNNTADFNTDGIVLYNSPDNSLTANTSNYNNENGIQLAYSSGNSLDGNTAYGNNIGIQLEHSSGNILTDDSAGNNSQGIQLTYSSENNLVGNLVNDNAVGIRLKQCSGDTLSSNTTNNNSGQGIYLDKGSASSILINNITKHNLEGILLDSAFSNTLVSNTADSNLQGIYLKNSYGDTLIGNNVNNNDRGIVLDSSSSNNYFASNNILGNSEYGAYLDNNSQFNTFWGNEFTGNGQDAYETENAADNNWNLDYIGNNWSDCAANPGFPYYYEISGAGDGIDYYPDCPLKLGDANGDGERSVSDVIYCINYLFKGGPKPVPLEIADSNCNGEVDVSDVIYLINFLFKSGPLPGC